jgi:hypothetical protein
VLSLSVKEGFSGADNQSAGKVRHAVDNLITGRMHGGKKGRGLTAVGSGDGSYNLGAEVMDATGRFEHPQRAAGGGQVAAIIQPGMAALAHGVGMFTFLQAGEHMGKVKRILRWLSKDDIGKGEDDMVFAVAAACRRACAIVGAGVVDGAFQFLDGVKLAYIEGILDGSLSNSRWLGAKMHAQPLDLVHSLILFEEGKGNGGQ